MQWEALVLTGVYLVYGVLIGTVAVVRFVGEQLGRQPDWLFDPGILPYTTKMEFFGVPSGLMVLGMIALCALAYRIFRSATDDYQDHYVQYLITDFLILRYSTVDSDGALSPPSGEKDDVGATPRAE